MNGRQAVASVCPIACEIEHELGSKDVSQKFFVHRTFYDLLTRSRISFDFMFRRKLAGTDSGLSSNLPRSCSHVLPQGILEDRERYTSPRSFSHSARVEICFPSTPVKPVSDDATDTLIRLGDQQKLIKYSCLITMLVVDPASTCDVCLEVYSVTREPYLLACGHVFCGR